MWPSSTTTSYTPQEGEFEDKEYKLLHGGWVLILVLEKGSSVLVHIHTYIPDADFKSRRCLIVFSVYCNTL
jgi:hypothetical protein